MSSSDLGTIEAVLRIAVDEPRRLASLPAPPQPAVFPAGPCRALWEEVWRRVAVGRCAPFGADELTDMLAIRGIPPKDSLAWWTGVSERTAAVPPTMLEGLVDRVVEAHASSTLMERATRALEAMRDRQAALGSSEDLRGIMAGALELGPDEASGSGVVSVEQADRISRERERISSEFAGAIGFTTGVESLDRVLGRLEVGELTVVAARAKVGKTHMATHLIEHVTGRRWPHLHSRRAGAVVVSLEMDAASVFNRLLARASNTDYSALLRDGRAHEVPELDDARKDLVSRAVKFIDSPGITVAGISARARAIASQMPVDMIVVDYLDLVRVNKASNERHDLQIGAIVRELLTLGRELNAHVVLLVQISRAGDQEAGLRHLANSDEIGRAAHKVLILNRPNAEPSGLLGLTRADSSPIVSLTINVTSRGPGTGANIPVQLDRSRSLFTSLDSVMEVIA